MRIGEVLNLRWSAIGDGKITLQRTETKQRKEKIIPITPAIQLQLDSMRDGRAGPLSYVVPRGGHWKDAARHGSKSLIQKVWVFSGVKDFDFHSLRHTAASIMVSEALGKGVGLADIMQILGHSNVDTTMRYLHPRESRMVKALEILEQKTIK